ERIKGKADGIERDGVAVGVPGVSMAAVACNVAIGIVGRRCSRNGGEAIGGCGVRGLECVRAAGFADVAERVVRERLRGSGAAVSRSDAGQIVVCVIAGLRIWAIELVGQSQLPKRAVRVPGEIASERKGRSTDVELELGHAQCGVVVSKDIVVAR